MTRPFGILLILAGLIFASLRGWYHISVSKEYTQKIYSYWDLSDKASTIVQKAEYLDKFILALQKERLEGTHDVLMYPNSSNSFNENLKALKSLQKRLKEVSTLNEESLAYQTAMQQITAQEQGDAKEMLDVLQGCWEKENHYTCWNGWIVLLFLLIQVLMVLFGAALISD